MSIPDKTRWFAEQVQPHEPALRAYLSRRFPGLPDHDDLVQEAYMRMLRVENPDRLTHPKAFLFTTARNAAIDLLRRLRSQPPNPVTDPEGLVQLALLDAPPTVMETLERRQRREALLRAMAMLPERCCEVMLLRYLDGLRGKEIAARLGISLGTVKGHLLKGVRDCARYFEAQGLAETRPNRTHSHDSQDSISDSAV